MSTIRDWTGVVVAFGMVLFMTFYPHEPLIKVSGAARHHAIVIGVPAEGAAGTLTAALLETTAANPR